MTLRVDWEIAVKVHPFKIPEYSCIKVRITRGLITSFSPQPSDSRKWSNFQHFLFSSWPWVISPPPAPASEKIAGPTGRGRDPLAPGVPESRDTRDPLAPAVPESRDTRMDGVADTELGPQASIQAALTPTTARASMAALQLDPDTTVAEPNQWPNYDISPALLTFDHRIKINFISGDL